MNAWEWEDWTLSASAGMGVDPTFIGVVNGFGTVDAWNGPITSNLATGGNSSVRTYLMTVPSGFELYHSTGFTFGGARPTTGLTRVGAGTGTLNFLRHSISFSRSESSVYWVTAGSLHHNNPPSFGWIWHHQAMANSGSNNPVPRAPNAFFLLIPVNHTATWTLGAADAVWPNAPTTGDRTTNVMHGTAPVQVAVPTRPHHTFTQWSDVTPMTGPRTITAQWTQTLRPVIFNPHGGTINGIGGNHTVNVISGQAVTRPTDPVRGGFEFMRWSSVQDGATPWDFATAINTPTTINATNTLHAVWRAITYADIILQIGNPLNDTSMSLVIQSQNYSTLNLTRYRPNHAVLNFLGWANTAQRARDRQVDLAATASITVNGNRSLYAVWDIDWNEVAPGIHGHNIMTLNFADGIDSTIFAQSRQYWSWDPTSRLLPNAQYMTAFAQGNPSFIGLEFHGWFDTAQFTGQPITIIPYTARGEIQMFARWVPIN